jgi:hypothetical protein
VIGDAPVINAERGASSRTSTRWTETRRAVLPLLVVMLVAMLALFEREWRHGEIFSPADLVFQFYPWSYDSPRTDAANPTRSDEAFYHQPLMASHFTRLRDGELPDYDDTRLSGVPSFFNGLDVGRAFSPFSLPYYLLPPEDAVNWYGPLRLLVAALAMWLLLRDLGAGAVAAAAGGVAYGLNGHFLTWLSAPMPTVAAWMPLVLRQVRRCVRRGGSPDVAGLALALGGLVLGTYMATTLVCLFGAAVYGVAEWWMADSDRRPARVPLALAAGGALGLCVGAASLWPMLAALRGSPASIRVVSAEGAPWANLATLALPDFWGSPVRGNWWHPDASANYPEHVAYFGIVVLLLASLALVARLPRDRSAIRWTFVLLTLVALTRAYGGVPGRWLTLLPGQAQSNPFRWYALAACGLAVLAGIGLQAWLEEPDRRRRLWLLAGPVAGAVALAGVAAAALLVFLPTLRVHNLQAFERAQVLRFVIIGGGSVLVLLVTAWLRDARSRMAGGMVLVALAAGDLVQAHRGFNPTVARDRYYPSTATLEWLREHAADARLAPVDPAADLVEGHVWGMFGLATVTGFDFHGDADYQALMRLAQQSPGTVEAARPPVWDYVGLRRNTLDLRLLGILGARYIVAAPVDLTPRSGGYSLIGPMVDGRTVTFTVPVHHDGVRGIDLLTATYSRQNRGRWHWTVADDTGRVLSEGRIEQATLRDNDWWRLAWTPVERSAGRHLTVTVRSDGSDEGSSATLLATASPSPVGTTLHIDGKPDVRALWFRSFSTAPHRFGDAPLVRSADLNVYRNPHARPRAWFVERVNVAATSTHASAMHTRPFDPAREAWVSESPAYAPAGSARVTSVSLDDDRRTIGVDAPDGGVLIVGDRAHSGWKVMIDGRNAPWQVADAVLIAVPVPPGSRSVTLEFRQPFVRPALGVSLLAAGGIAFALLIGVRRPRS